MGLMTLLARKINPDKQPQIRAPTYERKISSNSPVRFVQTVSSSGTISHNNGSPGLEKTTALRHPSSPLSQASFSVENAAPAPAVSGFRGDEALSRSKSSLGRYETSVQRTGKLTGPSKTSTGPSSRLSQLVIPRTRTSLVMSDTQRTEQKKHMHQISISSSKVASSIRSSGSRGYVDLLDAQSELKPSDFHGRIKAAGTRDYGEDVADRNIGVNGCNLDSPPVQAFYAVGQRAFSRASTRDRLNASSERNRRFESSDDDNYIVNQPHVVKLSSIDSALRSKAHSPPPSAHLGNIQSRAVLNAAALQRSRNLHSRASDSVLPPISPGGYDACSLTDAEALHQQEQDSLERRTRSYNLNGPARDTNSLLLSQIVAPQEPAISSSAARPSTSGSMSRRVSASRKGDTGLGRLNDSESTPRFDVSNQSSLPSQPTTLRLSASLSSSALAARSKRRPTTQNIHSVQLSHQSSSELHKVMSDFSDLPDQVKETLLYIDEDWQNTLTDQESAPSPFIKKNRSRSRSRGHKYDYSHASSSVAPQQRYFQTSGIEDQTSAHTNSIRHWSMSSTAPTTYSLSSVTYGRPHSRHTAETSVDLSNTGPPSTTNKKEGSRPDSELSPRVGLNGHASSDSDSFLASQEEGSASEEDLLFSDGYGKNGMQLPGLGDTFEAAAPAGFLGGSRREYRRSFSESPQPYDSALKQMTSDESLALFSKHSQRARSKRTADPNLKKNFPPIEPSSRAHNSTRRCETKRLSALHESTTTTGHSHYGDDNADDGGELLHAAASRICNSDNRTQQQGAKEEKLDRINVLAAIRLRKEAKSRKRFSTSRSPGPIDTDDFYEQNKTRTTRSKASPSVHVPGLD